MMRKLMMNSIKVSAGSSSLLGGLVGAWKFDSNSIDALGLNNGTDEDGITYNVGKNAECATFPGDKIITLSSSPLSGTTPFTLFCWVRCNNTFGAFPGIFGCGIEVPNRALFFALNPTGRVVGDLHSVGGIAESAVGVADGNWHHVGLIFSSGHFQLYVDGNASGISVAASPNLGFGGGSYGTFGKVYSSGNILQGDLDDFYIWNRDLTASEVTELYDSGNGKVYPF